MTTRPLFEWSTSELAKYTTEPDDPDIAILAARELERREHNRVAKRAGRPTIPPPEDVRVPVEKAREFREADVKRDADGRFSTTRGAKRPKPPSMTSTSNPHRWDITYQSSTEEHVIRDGDGNIVTYIASRDGSPSRAIDFRNQARDQWNNDRALEAERGTTGRPKPPAALTEAQEPAAPTTDDIADVLGLPGGEERPQEPDDALDKSTQPDASKVLSQKGQDDIPVMFGATEREWNPDATRRASMSLGLAHGLSMPGLPSMMELREQDGHFDVVSAPSVGEESLIARFTERHQANYFVIGARHATPQNAPAYLGYKDWGVQPHDDERFRIVHQPSGEHVFYAETMEEAREFYNSFRDANAAFQQQRDAIDPPPAPEESVPPPPMSDADFAMSRHEARIEEAMDAKQQAAEQRDALRESILNGTYDGEHATPGDPIPGEQMMLPGFDAPEDFGEYRKLDAKVRDAKAELERRKAVQQEFLGQLNRLEEDELDDFDLSDPEDVELFAEKLFGMTTSTGFTFAVSRATPGSYDGDTVDVGGYVLKPDSYSQKQLDAMTLPQLETVMQERGLQYHSSSSGDGRKRELARTIMDRQRIGAWDRTIDLDGDGDWSYPEGGYVYHNSFTIDADYQGEGLMEEWFDQLFKGYAHMGLSHVRVHANITIGGYAWAAKGFEWEQPPYEISGMDSILARRARDTINYTLDRHLNDALLPDGEDATMQTWEEVFTKHNIEPERFDFTEDGWDEDEAIETIERFVDSIKETLSDPYEMQYARHNLEDATLDLIEEGLGQDNFMQSSLPWSLELIEQTFNFVQSVEDGEVAAWEAAQWLNEPEFRWTSGKHTLWPGKSVLIGADWNGWRHI